jgi:hypothetical protein
MHSFRTLWIDGKEETLFRLSDLLVTDHKSFFNTRPLGKKIVRQFTFLMNSLLLLFFIALLVRSSFSEVLCEQKGGCHTCKKDELFNDYCKVTGRVVSMICNDGNNQYEEFRPCERTAEDEQIRVVVFQVVMGVVGGVAYWLAQKRKVNTMTLFDSRKQRYVYFDLQLFF